MFRISQSKPNIKDERRSRPILTLSETLATLAMLTVLAVTLVPTFLAARERDRQATCVSNLEQLAMAFQQYAQDNDQTLFNPFYFEYYKGDRDCGYTADSTLEPYIKNHAAHDVSCVWVCPQVSMFGSPRANSQVGFGAFYCTYTMNVFLNAPQPRKAARARAAIPEPDVCYSDIPEQSTIEKSWNGGGLREDLMTEAEPQYVAGSRLLPGLHPRTLPVLRPTRLGVRLSQIPSPGAVDLLFEGIVENYNAERIDTGYVGRAPRQGDYTLDQGFWPDDWTADHKWAYPVQPPELPRHGRLNNYLFCDGHVKALKPRRFPYDIQHDPDNIWFARIGRDGRSIPPPGGPGCS